MVSAVMTTRVCTPKPPYTMVVVMMRRVRSRHARHAMAVLVVSAAHGRVAVPLLLVGARSRSRGGGGPWRTAS